MRLPASWDVWVYWECGHLHDVSHVRDLSLGGLFLETHRRRPNGDLLSLHFLVPEGQIRLDALVVRSHPGNGLGLKFKSVANEDIPQLSSLLERMRSTPFAAPAPARPIGISA
jgi:PilZ domain